MRDALHNASEWMSLVFCELKISKIVFHTVYSIISLYPYPKGEPFYVFVIYAASIITCVMTFLETSRGQKKRSILRNLQFGQ